MPVEEEVLIPHYKTDPPLVPREVELVAYVAGFGAVVRNQRFHWDEINQTVDGAFKHLEAVLDQWRIDHPDELNAVLLSVDEAGRLYRDPFPPKEGVKAHVTKVMSPFSEARTRLSIHDHQPDPPLMRGEAELVAYASDQPELLVKSRRIYDASVHDDRALTALREQAGVILLGWAQELHTDLIGMLIRTEDGSLGHFIDMIYPKAPTKSTTGETPMDQVTKRVTLNLTRRSAEAKERLSQRMEWSQTETINRSIQITDTVTNAQEVWLKPVGSEEMFRVVFS